MENGLLSIRNLQTHFLTREGLRKAVDGVNLEVKKGDLLGIAGESGCGKSTLSLSILRLITRPGKIVGGEIWFDGKDLLLLGSEEMRKIRGKKITMVFQEPMTSLNPVFTIGTQISDMVVEHEGLSRQKAKERAVEVLDSVFIPNPERIVNTYPHQLSGGMRQRAMIAMALSCKPDLLIGDEPTSALDTVTQLEIVKLLKELKERLGMTMILISHNLYFLSEMCKRIAIMYAGNLVENVETGTLFRKPKHPYTMGLIDSIPKFKGEIRTFKTIRGEPPDLSSIPAGCPFNPRCDYVMDICRRDKPPLVDVAKGHFVACHLYD
ncbi:MAG TPA: ABC transporter ATP-binding protein [Candidatus Bathyarchaeia archaeon]|nr:ABC transporter ATP-binding protein [Candidatus Bathyarchaeia archaeon]